MKPLFRLQPGSQSPIRLFPLALQLKDYSREKLFADLRAGFNVAVLSFPVNMAYALVAGLPIYYGIYSGIVASLVALIFCRSIYVTFGPSNATAVMLLSAFAVSGLATEAARMAALPGLVLFVGVFLVISSVFKLTFLISYISRTVIIGYVTAGAILIFANQMRNLLGFSYPPGETATTAVEAISLAIRCAGDTKFWSLAMAIITLAVFLPIKVWLKKLPAEGITLIAMAIICYVATTHFDVDIDRLNAVSATGWKTTLPDFQVIGVRESAVAALAVALLCIIEAVSIGKSLASSKAERFDTNQEIFALGISNIACSFSSSTLASGSLTRSSLAVFSGAQTTLYNLFTTIFTLAALLVFGNAIEFVPKATLALIVVYTSMTLIKIKNIKVALKSTMSDAIVFILTFGMGMFSSLDDAIYTGIGMSILLFLRKASAPEVVEYAIGDDGELAKICEKTARSTPEISIVHVEGNMFFGASDVLQNQLRRISAEPNLKVLILKLRNAINFDATSVMDIEELWRRMKQSDRTLIICEVRPDVMSVLKHSGVYKKIGAEDIFENDEDNPTLSAARAIKAAQKHLKGEDVKVTIYANKPMQ